MGKDNTIARHFGANLARLLAGRIRAVRPDFDGDGYVAEIAARCDGMAYAGRVSLHAEALRTFLPEDYEQALGILVAILGDENPNETGMFSEYYWALPLGKFVETYGLDHFDASIRAIAEITKRNTGEYAIRPFLRRYPENTLAVLRDWAVSESFHLRRLASEGCRPKLPWATKLDEFVDDPSPVFAVLDLLIEDDVKFVMKSVANNIADHLKVNESAALGYIDRHRDSSHSGTRWILRHATRKRPDLREGLPAVAPGR